MLKKIKKHIAISIMISTLYQIITPIQVCANAKYLEIKTEENSKFQKEQINEKKEEVKKSQYDLEKKMNELMKKIKDTENRINKIDKETETNQSKIDVTIQKIIEIEQKSKEISEEIVKQENDQKKLISMYLEYVKITGKGFFPSILAQLILGSKDLSEFNNKSKYLGEWGRRVKKNQEKFEETTKNLAKNKSELDQLASSLKEENKKQSNIVNENCEKSTNLYEYAKELQNDYKELECITDNLKKKNKECNEAIKAIEKHKEKIEKNSEKDNHDEEIAKAIEDQKKKDEQNKKDKEEQKKNQKANPSTSENQDGYAYPVKGRSAISQGFHSKHSGVDISTHGQANPVVSVASGTVVAAGKNLPGYSRYGNVIVILHDNGISTLYAHLSTVLVKKGMRVERAQNIGNVGMTGSADGMHLHFEARKNGVRTNPSGILFGKNKINIPPKSNKINKKSDTKKNNIIHKNEKKAKKKI